MNLQRTLTFSTYHNQLSYKITNIELRYFNHIADPNRQVSIFLTLFICSSKYLCFHMLLQVMSKVVGRATSPSCSGCWCRWSCGCFLCRVRLELRLSSTVLCQMKLPSTAGATSSTADQLPCVLSQEMLGWQKNCGRPVRGWWNWPDGGSWGNCLCFHFVTGGIYVFFILNVFMLCYVFHEHFCCVQFRC